MNWGKIIQNWLIGLALLLMMFVGLFFQLLFMSFPWDYRQYLIVGFFVLSAILILVLLRKSNYYIVDKNQIILVKNRREQVYKFEHILYIDEELSIKKKILCFYTTNGNIVYLPFDQKNHILEYSLKYSKNRLDKESFQEQYPNISF